MFNRRGPQRFNPYNNFQQQFTQPQSPFGPQMMGQEPSSFFPNIQGDRLQLEIRENRRRINNLAKRIIRIENYLRIRDTSDYSIIEEDQVPNEFSM